MTTADQLLHVILDNPEDDNIRLVYADCLEENGQVERAEFIRVQVELAGLSPCGGGYAIGAGQCPVCARILALRRRERELLSEHYRQWMWSDLLGVTGRVFWEDAVKTYRRGLVEAVTLSAEDALAHLDAVLACLPVTEVTLTSWPLLRYHYREKTWDLVAGNGISPHATEFMLPTIKKRWPRVRTWHLPPQRRREIG